MVDNYSASDDVTAGIVRLVGSPLTKSYHVLTAGTNGCLYALPKHAGHHVLEVDAGRRQLRTIGHLLPKEVGTETQKLPPYSCCVATQSGRLYAPPFGAEQVLEIDPASGQVQRLGPRLPLQSRGYRAVAAAPNGCCYAPVGGFDKIDSMAEVLEINGNDRSVSLRGKVEDAPVGTLPWMNATGDHVKYACIALAGDGRMIAPPSNATKVLFINPADGTMETKVSPGASDEQAEQGYVRVTAATSNGMLYFVRKDLPQFLTLDPGTGTMRRLGEDLERRYHALCEAGNGCLYSMQMDARLDSCHILEVDPRSQQVTEKLVMPMVHGEAPLAGEFTRLAAAGNGRLYAMPRGGRVLEFDPVASVVRFIGQHFDCKYQTPVVMDGRVFALPSLKHQAGHIIMVDYPSLPLHHIDTVDHWHRLLDDGDMSDVVLKTNAGKTYRLHKLVLSLRSKVFHSILHSAMREASDAVVDLGDVCPAVSDMFVNHLYTKRPVAERMSVQELCELSALAHRYAVEELVASCTELLIQSIQVNSAAVILRLADRLELHELKHSSLDFIVANPQVTRTDEWEEVPPPLLREVMEAMGGRRRKRRRPCDWEFPGGTDWAKLSLPDLRRACAERGLAQEGDRVSLLERLNQ